MKPFIAIVTGLHVLAHGVFGCCDHGVAANGLAVVRCDCHHDHHLAAEEHADDLAPHADGQLLQRGSSNPAPHECAHAACHWLAGSAGPNVTPLDFSLPAAVAVVATILPATVDAAGFQPDHVVGRTSALPLRLHLALGVLVV